MKEFIELSLVAFLGMLLHLLKKLKEARSKEGHTLGGFIQDQSIPTIGSIIATPLTIYLIWDNPGLREMLPLTSLTACGIGYVGQSVILSFLDGKFKPKKPE